MISIKRFFIIFIIVILSATTTYFIKYRIQRLHFIVNNMKKEIEEERNSIRLLRANLAFLINPKRMQKFAVLYKKELGLQSIRPEQIVKIIDIPKKKLDPIKHIIIEQKNFILLNYCLK